MLKRRVDVLNRQMADNQTAMIEADTSPEEVLTRMREDASARRHLVQQILPREIRLMRKHVQDLEEIQASAPTADLLKQINERINSLNRDINKIMEKKMLHQTSVDDKLSLFQQNVSEFGPWNSMCPGLHFGVESDRISLSIGLSFVLGSGRKGSP